MVLAWLSADTRHQSLQLSSFLFAWHFQQFIPLNYELYLLGSVPSQIISPKVHLAKIPVPQIVDNNIQPAI